MKHRHDDDKRKNNVLRIPDSHTLLMCGHTTPKHPIATYANGRKLFDCPQGCGLQKGKR